MGRDGMVLSKRTHTDGELLLHDTKPDGGYGAPDQGGHTAPPSPAPDTPTKPLLPPPEPSAAAPRSRGRLVRQFLEVTRPFFSVENPRRATAALWLGASVLLLVGESLCLVWFSYAQKELTTSMAERSREGFWRAVHSYLLIVLVACPLMALAEFCEERFVLLWRQWLTGHCMERYWQGRCFYTLGRDGAIDHPDQRICEDVANFTNRACGLLLKVAARAGNVVSFVAVLWAVSPPLVAFLLAYCAATTLLVTLGLGERLERLEVDRRVAEAGFRCGMMRGLEHSEEIAFYNAGGLERKGCDAKFAAVVAIARRLISVGLLLHLLQYTIEYVTILLPYLFVADRYFSGEMEFGVLSQTAMAFRLNSRWQREPLKLESLGSTVPDTVQICGNE
jgi:putative ATP-binding cassette transporter